MSDTISLLWPNKELEDIWSERLGTEFSGSIKRDLNAERVVNAVFAKVKKYREHLDLLFYYPCREEETITFRLAIMEDILKIPSLYQTLWDYSRLLPELKEAKEKSNQHRAPEQDAAWLLHLASIYIKSVTDISTQLTSYPIKSEGLLRMRDHFNGIYDGDAFKQLAADTKKLSDEMYAAGHYFFAMNNDPNSLAFIANPDIESSEKNTITYKIIDKASILFRTEQKVSCSIYNNIPLSSLEQEMINALKKQRPETFALLRDFETKYRSFDFEEKGIEEYEFDFFLAYIDFIRTLEERGFQFCIPRVSKEEQRVFGAYDLGLAQEFYENGGSAKDVIANDFAFTPEERILIITGPNQGGKTTFARSVGLLQVLAQCGCPVPAKDAQIMVMDRMFTQFPEREIVGTTKGRLGEEVQRIADMLHSVTSRSFIIFNESFASARRADGVEMGKQLIKRLLDIGCHVLFVTHLYELGQDLEDDGDYRGTASFMAEAQETEDGTGRRTYKIIRKTSTGIAFSQDICKRCGTTLQQLESLLKSRNVIREGM